MNENTKAYEVVLSSGEVKTIEANDVQLSNGRVSFVGTVEGHRNGYGDSSEVVESFRSELVDSYRVVPVPERDGKTEGKNVYRFTFKDGSDAKDVKGDFVTHAEGGQGKPGRYTVATRLKNHNERTEFVVADEQVQNIERVTDTVPAQGKAVKASTKA